MYRRVLGFDFDGTLAEDGQVPPMLHSALERLSFSGYSLFLVTGRQFETVSLGPLSKLFTGIVWENGAVLQQIGNDELYLPFGYVDPRLVRELEVAGVPLEHGVAIVSTWTEYEETVWRVLSECASDAAIVHNKGALMISPPGSAKGSGLARLLDMCGFSPRNLVGFGDGENDLSLLQLGESGVAVADAVSSLKEVANLVTKKPGPAGILEVLEEYWFNGRAPDIPVRQENAIRLGRDEGGQRVLMPGATLVSQNLGVFGDSGSGKSWLTGLLAEGMHLAGYQVLLIDPEGDFRGLRSLPRMMAVSGDKKTLPMPAIITTLLDEASTSVVLDLCNYPVEERESYIAELMVTLRPLKENRYRPQWIVLEESQSFLPPNEGPVKRALEPMLAGGGWTFVSYRPDRMDLSILAALHHCFIARLREPESIQELRRILEIPSSEELANTAVGNIWLCGRRLIRLRPAGRRVPHMRHLYKYLDIPLPRHKRFYFHTKEGFLGKDAASLFEFKEILLVLPVESLAYHLERGDFAAWARKTLDDEILAGHFDKLAHRPELKGEELRQALLERVSARYAEIYAMR